MSKLPHLLVIVPSAAVLISCTLQQGTAEASPANTPAEQQPQRQRAVNVSRMWTENCSNCHGDNGQGGGAGTKTLLTRELFSQDHDKRFFDAIKKGVPEMAMPAYGETLSDAEIWGLVVHTRELQNRALRAEGNGTLKMDGISATKYHNYSVQDVVTTGLRTPWGIDWLPDGSMLIANRPGRLVLAKGEQVKTVEGTPPVLDLGQGGLMEVSLHPDYKKNGWIYLAFTDPAKENPRWGMTKIVRGKIKVEADKVTWTDQQTIFELDQKFYSGSGVHFGCRIVFDKGKIFFAIGERGSGQHAQDLTRPNGKVYRVNDDGSVPADNPFVSTPDALKAIWSYGHRNPQGLVMDLEGNLWDTEHGPRGGDELNHVQKGANYGWPLVSFGINYNDSPFATPWLSADQKITMPVLRWLPSIAACGLDVVQGPAFPSWKGDLVAGGLAGQMVQRIRVKGGKLVEHEELVYGMGRVRDVEVGPDGMVYIALNEPDKIVRLSPAR